MTIYIHLRTAVIVALTMSILPGCTAAPHDKGQATPRFFGFAVHGNPVSSKHLAELRKVIGKPPDIVLFYMQWPPPGELGRSPFPRKSVERIQDGGSVPCITWEPMYFKAGREVTIRAADITSGAYDEYIRNFAAEVKAWGKPILVRFAHEMNLHRYHWGVEQPNYDERATHAYKAMFRHVVTVARRAGGKNIAWVFCPNAESVPSGTSDPRFTWNIAANYYPGDGFVDVLGLDGYNWGQTQTTEENGWTSRWQTFEEIFTLPSRDLRTVAPSKPLIVFETGSVGSDAQKSRWLKNAAEACARLKILGIVWFQVKKENNWLLPRDAASSPRRTSDRSAVHMQAWMQELRR